MDYQGQRQSIGRTVTSTVPTLLQRQGIFTEPIGGRVPAIYDPATTVGTVAHAVCRTTRFRSAGWIRSRVALLQRYPLPTAAGTANNYSRTANEVDNQDQWDVRIDHEFATNRDQVFGRLSVLPRRFRAGDAAARRQRRHDRHARARRTRPRGRSRRTTSTRSRRTC